MNEQHPERNFPKHFFWGASTAAHQVEGGLYNQWSKWELEHAKELAQTAHQRLSWLPNWNKIKDQAEEPENYVSGKGVDHFNRYEEDFDIAKKLNLDAFRFTIEWSRIEPQEGVWDEAAVKHYQTYIKQLRARKLEPFLNIWHWTVPVWFAEKGGFANRKNLDYFTRFVQKVADDLVDDVEYVLVLNEPNVEASFSYLTSMHPPAERSVVKFIKSYWNLVLAQRRSYKILKAKKPTLQVGIAMQLANIQAKRPHKYLDEVTTKWMRYFWNWWFLRRIRKSQDLIGLNYYFSDYFTGLGKRANPKVPLNDMGWYMEPEGIYPLLLRTWSRFKKPIFITENGLADADDVHRRWWIEETIVAMELEISEGVDLSVYIHLILLDNFD